MQVETRLVGVADCQCWRSELRLMGVELRLKHAGDVLCRLRRIGGSESEGKEWFAEECQKRH